MIQRLTVRAPTIRPAAKIPGATPTTGPGVLPRTGEVTIDAPTQAPRPTSIAASHLARLTTGSATVVVLS